MCGVGIYEVEKDPEIFGWFGGRVVPLAERDVGGVVPVPIPNENM